ncbi:MAG TPA: right-handed parallel beta-helix repeat-containing protein, partial [Luteimonas sp.]|nr:right-handed parallel beta-helix repeat-containing protein [Luteimonas sp.]
MFLRPLLLLCLLLTGAGRAHAAQSYDNCVGYITTLPAVITTQGTWCLKQDLATAITSGSAITINNNNVTIDCNDFKLGGLSAGTGTLSSGIYAVSRSNITVRRCNVRGFFIGVNLYATTTGGNLVEDNRLDGNTLEGLSVFGDGSIVRRNVITNTGGSTSISKHA